MISKEQLENINKAKVVLFTYKFTGEALTRIYLYIKSNHDSDYNGVWSWNVITNAVTAEDGQTIFKSHFNIYNAIKSQSEKSPIVKIIYTEF